MSYSITPNNDYLVNSWYLLFNKEVDISQSEAELQPTEPLMQINDSTSSDDDSTVIVDAAQEIECLKIEQNQLIKKLAQVALILNNQEMQIFLLNQELLKLKQDAIPQDIVNLDKLINLIVKLDASDNQLVIKNLERGFKIIDEAKKLIMQKADAYAINLLLTEMKNFSCEVNIFLIPVGKADRLFAYRCCLHLLLVYTHLLKLVILFKYKPEKREYIGNAMCVLANFNLSDFIDPKSKLDEKEITQHAKEYHLIMNDLNACRNYGYKRLNDIVKTNGIGVFNVCSKNFGDFLTFLFNFLTIVGKVRNPTLARDKT